MLWKHPHIITAPPPTWTADTSQVGSIDSCHILTLSPSLQCRNQASSDQETDVLSVLTCFSAHRLVIWVVIWLTIAFLLAWTGLIILLFAAFCVTLERLFCVKIPGAQHILKSSNQPVWHQQPRHNRCKVTRITHVFPRLMIDVDINESAQSVSAWFYILIEVAGEYLW